jgi:hypothetical protein
MVASVPIGGGGGGDAPTPLLASAKNPIAIRFASLCRTSIMDALRRFPVEFASCLI